jgi:hypothetical protein
MLPLERLERGKLCVIRRRMMIERISSPVFTRWQDLHVKIESRYRLGMGFGQYAYAQFTKGVVP